MSYFITTNARYYKMKDSFVFMITVFYYYYYYLLLVLLLLFFLRIMASSARFLSISILSSFHFASACSEALDKPESVAAFFLFRNFFLFRRSFLCFPSLLQGCLGSRLQKRHFLFFPPSFLFSSCCFLRRGIYSCSCDPILLLLIISSFRVGDFRSASIRSLIFTFTFFIIWKLPSTILHESHDRPIASIRICSAFPIIKS